MCLTRRWGMPPSSVGCGTAVLFSMVKSLERDSSSSSVWYSLGSYFMIVVKTMLPELIDLGRACVVVYKVVWFSKKVDFLLSNLAGANFQPRHSPPTTTTTATKHLLHQHTREWDSKRHTTHTHEFAIPISCAGVVLVLLSQLQATLHLKTTWMYLEYSPIATIQIGILFKQQQTLYATN